ncbi:MAG: hypothetical protein Phog2KO_13360 [Phototrophicaceae bacterium]
MRKMTWIVSFVVMMLFALSITLATPLSVSAIGEVTPTPDPNEVPTEEQEEVDVEALIEEGLINIQEGEFRSALANMDTVINADPSVMTAYLIRGVANSQLGLTDDAIADFSSAIELEPWQLDLYIFRGDTYRNNGDFTDALLDFDQAIYINPLTAEAYLRRSDVNYALGDTVAGDVDDLIARGLGASNLGDTASAFDFLDEAIELGEGLESVGSAYYIRAITNMRAGDADDAFDDYEAGLDADPNLHNIYLGRGILYREEGDLQAAGEDFYNRITIHGDETVETDMEIGDTIEVEMAYRRVVEISFEGEEGQEITISADDFGDTIVDPLITLLDPDGNPIAGDDDFGGVLNSLIDDFELPEDGTYTLMVSHAEGGYTFGFNGLIQVEIDD